MTRQKPIEVITPPNVLKTKIGGALPALDQKAIARAEAALEKMSSQFAEWIKEELERLLEAWGAYEAAPGTPVSRNDSSPSRLTPKIFKGFNLTIGISAHPSTRVRK
jgi:hypothetical protein